MFRLVVLGTAQDGGVPHLGCKQAYCERARRDATFARRVACLGLIDDAGGRLFLIDATPDIRSQLDLLAELSGRERTSRNPIDGVILTHAHIGHYTGLVQFGKEVMATRQLPVFASSCMLAYLKQNGPWSKLISDEHLSPRVLVDGQPEQLTEQVAVRPMLVPHRDEWADTIGLEIRGRTQRALYIPDIDRWSDWKHDIRAVVADCDLALLDGCFFSADELLGRDMSQVPHPLMQDSLSLLKEQAGKVYFTHLNHTNGAIDPDSNERRTVESAGFHVAEERQIFVLA
jgi:pyrroloquinoline quinone biosynthesis protein B